MTEYLPGTVISADLCRKGAAKELLSPAFITKGLVLSQVSELTGIEPYTVQNWVKRGFVKPPEGKKYTKRQFCRLVIINAFKEVLEIGDITAFISYINGSLDDESDDRLADDELYFCFTDAAAELYGKPVSAEMIRAVSDKAAKAHPECGERLATVLFVMLDAYFAYRLKKSALSELEKIKG